jgi:uncharacterized membrane protein HdeD (DUF308 family)
MRNKMPTVKSKLALLGGLIHVAAAIGILFFPVFTACINQDCYAQSYIQLGGNALGYSFLLSMILAGMATIYSSFIANVQRANAIRLLVLFASAIVIVVAGFSFGSAFIPGALLILFAVLFQTVVRKPQIEVQK